MPKENKNSIREKPHENARNSRKTLIIRNENVENLTKTSEKSKENQRKT